MKNRVCFISIYFGKIPDSISLFFESCKWNVEFDWLFIHDKELNFNITASNIKSLLMSLEEFRERLTNVSDVNIPLFEPYKVCDFRPAFGEVFQEELTGYEFWGIVDTDLILGDLSHFLTDDLLNKFDKIYTVGHLSVVRNNPYINSLYKKNTKNSRDYKQIFTNPNSCVYDEYEGFNEKFEDNGLKLYKYKECADVCIVCKRIKTNTLRKVKLVQYRNKYLEFCESKNYRYQLFTINQGKIFKYYIAGKKMHKKEYSYIHKIDFSGEHIEDKNGKYIITKDGLVKNDEVFSKLENGIIDRSDFNMYNKACLIRESLCYSYLFLRLKLRKYRKICLPRRDEL